MIDSIAFRLQLLHEFLLERSRDPLIQTCFVMQAPTVSRSLCFSVTDSSNEIHVSLYTSPEIMPIVNSILGPQDEDREGIWSYKNGLRLHDSVAYDIAMKSLADVD